MNVPLRCPDYSCVSRRAKSVNVSFKTPTRGEIAHLVIDSTGLKVFGEGEWKVKKHGQNAAVSGVSCISPLTVKHMKSSVQTCR
ncbi:transposase [Enterobacter hormaechei]